MAQPRADAVALAPVKIIECLQNAYNGGRPPALQPLKWACGVINAQPHGGIGTGHITNALLHRVGRLALGESSVLACVSAPHRPEAFEAARYAIDALKASAPIWKHEVWADGAGWGTGAHDIVEPRSVPTAGGAS